MGPGRGYSFVYALFLSCSTVLGQTTPPPLKAYYISAQGTQTLSGTVTVSSSDPTIQSGTRDVTAADLVALPPYPSGVLPACYYRGANGWIPFQGQGANKSDGYTDLAASSVSTGGVLTIKREVNRSSDLDGSHQTTAFNSTTHVDLEAGTSDYHFNQNDTSTTDPQDTSTGSFMGTSISDSWDVSIFRNTVSLREAPFSCPYPTLTLYLPRRYRRRSHSHCRRYGTGRHRNRRRRTGQNRDCHPHPPCRPAGYRSRLDALGPLRPSAPFNSTSSVNRRRPFKAPARSRPRPSLRSAKWSCPELSARAKASSS